MTPMMPPPLPASAVQPQSPPTTPATGYRGQVSFLYAFNIAHEMTRSTLSTLLGHRVGPFDIASDKRMPREAFFFRPQMVELDPVTLIGPTGPVQVRRTLKVFPVGSLSVALHVPFEVGQLDGLVDFHDFPAAHQHARALAQEALTELRPHLIQPVSALRDEEAYTIFCLEWKSVLTTDRDTSAEVWLQSRRAAVAGLLTQEADPRRLSEQETRETAGVYLSYYHDDLLVLDWDAALLIDEPPEFDPVLHIIELTNVQLAELESYDRKLDDVLERSYRDMAGGKGGSKARTRKAIVRELREIRLDLARLSDELSNTTKFFGEWHLARVYQNLSARFHLADWHRVIDDKLSTVDDLYRILLQDRTNRQMVVLEALIVALFVIDLVMIALMPH